MKNNILISAIILIMLTKVSGNAQKINADILNSEHVIKTQIEISSLCPQPTLIWPDTSNSKEATIYRSMGGDVLCLPAKEYTALSVMMRDYISKFTLQSERRCVLINMVIIRIDDKDLLHNKIFKLTNEELNSVFKAIANKMNETDSMIAQKNAEQIKLIFNKVYNCNN